MKAQLRMGQIYLVIHETLEARKTVKLLLEKMPDDVEVLHLFAGVQIQEKNLVAAKGTLQKAVSISPQNLNTRLFWPNYSCPGGILKRRKTHYCKPFQSIRQASPP